ncbi:hypothetical protein BDZ91DRAFT_362745 [Kalaharituber pfeilii]|nr:hypothetical protein BDZ91DRAFT_362745 [Kalaharituber pfeilii]
MLDQFERFKFPDKENTQYQHLSNKNLSRLQEVKATLKGLNNHITRVYTLQQDTFHLFSDLKAKNERISELTREILRLGDTRPDASRDDYYFATKFAGVFRAVEEWVYLTFLHADHGQQIQEQQIQEEVVNLLHKTAGAGWQPWLEEEHILLFTGVITEMLVSKVMELPILGMNNPYVALLKPTIEKSFVESIHQLEPVMRAPTSKAYSIHRYRRRHQMACHHHRYPDPLSTILGKLQANRT